jgi:hypothetical protein
VLINIGHVQHNILHTCCVEAVLGCPRSAQSLPGTCLANAWQMRVLRCSKAVTYRYAQLQMQTCIVSSKAVGVLP